MTAISIRATASRATFSTIRTALTLTTDFELLFPYQLIDSFVGPRYWRPKVRKGEMEVSAPAKGKAMERKGEIFYFISAIFCLFFLYIYTYNRNSFCIHRE